MTKINKNRTTTIRKTYHNHHQIKGKENEQETLTRRDEEDWNTTKSGGVRAYLQHHVLFVRTSMGCVCMRRVAREEQGRGGVAAREGEREGGKAAEDHERDELVRYVSWWSRRR